MPDLRIFPVSEDFPTAVRREMFNREIDTFRGFIGFKHWRKPENPTKLPQTFLQT
jgi:hypothetical protein